jgi:hypothetical protein
VRLPALCARSEQGNEFERALTVCVLNKAPQEEAKVLMETSEHHVGPFAQVGRRHPRIWLGPIPRGRRPHAGELSPCIAWVRACLLCEARSCPHSPHLVSWPQQEVQTGHSSSWTALVMRQG